MSSFFTCQPVAPNSNSPFDVGNTATRFDAKPIGPSLDHVIAKQLSPDGKPLVIHLAEPFTAEAAISYSPAENGFSNSSSEEARLRYAESWVSFAFRRAPNAADACIVQDLAERLAEGSTIFEMMAAITLADSFQLRTRGKAS